MHNGGLFMLHGAILYDIPCSLDIRLYWAVKMLIYWAAWAEITNQPKSKQITFHRGDFMYHRFLQTAWLAQKESSKNEYLMSRQYFEEFSEKNKVKFSTNLRLRF